MRTHARTHTQVGHCIVTRQPKKPKDKTSGKHSSKAASMADKASEFAKLLDAGRPKANKPKPTSAFNMTAEETETLEAIAAMMAKPTPAVVLTTEETETLEAIAAMMAEPTPAVVLTAEETETLEAIAAMMADAGASAPNTGRPGAMLTVIIHCAAAAAAAACWTRRGMVASLVLCCASEAAS